MWLFSGAAMGLLVFGADRLVNAAVRLAKTLRISTVIIGATVVSLGTTAPEVFISVTAAFRGRPGLALGNGVGSIICNTAFIFGLCCLIVRLPKDRFVLDRQGWCQLAAGTLLTATVFALALAGGGFEGAVIPRFVGICYVLLLVGYLYLSIRWARAHPQTIPDRAEAAASTHRFSTTAMSFLLLAVGLAIVIAGANLLIGSVGVLCERYGVPESVLAVTVVAFGTSLPELVTAIASIVKGRAGLLVGNVIGANILNVLLVVGASATAVPLRVDNEFFYLHLPVMMLSLILLRLYFFSGGRSFRRWQGIPLLAVFFGYYALLLLKFGPRS